jgi:hypothetical protein
MVKLRLDRGEVREDVGVIELEVVQHRGARQVMDELRSFVEERGVVLVRLDDEGRTGTEPGGTAEVLGHATDEKPRVPARGGKHGSQHRRRRRLAVGSGHGKNMALAQHMLRKPLRTRDERQLAIKNRLHQRIPARDDVADDVQLRVQRELVGPEPLDQFDPGLDQLVAHWRVDVRVAAADPMPGGPGKLGEPAHEGPANAEDVDVHGKP